MAKILSSTFHFTSPASRTPLLLIIFSIFLFFYLWYINGPPGGDSSERGSVCLDENALTWNPSQKKAKAAIVVLVRNNERSDMHETILNFESRFNKNFHYPYVFLNDVPFTEEFKTFMHEAAPKSDMQFGIIPKEHWSYPSWVNQTYAAECRNRMGKAGIYYGESESYRHMCRFNSGWFFRHKLLANYDWYWRLEPGVRFFCDITYDPFLYMEKRGKLYSFVITLTEIPQTIPSLWQTVIDYAKERNIDISEDNKNSLLFPYFRSDDGSYNLCHFWSNFEIASLKLWRSKQYIDFFNYLDRTGNFFYERWGDAPVHSLAAGLFLQTDQVHYFEDIGYQHDWYRHCPPKGSNLDCRCKCPEGDTKASLNVDWQSYSCLPQWRAWIEKMQKAKPVAGRLGDQP